ncbi:MAG: hypothetical protein KGJ49_13980 [Alphaproteobacteria bacterium]|nr:hypothetical protein [Alphaproteobacteria bacterium]
MKRLPDLPIELKALASAALIYVGFSVLMGFTYIVTSHRGLGGSYRIGPSDIAALYTGPGVSTVTLISIAHVHLLGLFAIFSIVGYIFVHSTLSTGWKVFWSMLPFVAFPIDVTSWFLTKFVAYDFVYLVIAAGATFILSLAAMIFMSFFDLWIAPIGVRAKQASREALKTSEAGPRVPNAEGEARSA